MLSSGTLPNTPPPNLLLLSRYFHYLWIFTSLIMTCLCLVHLEFTLTSPYSSFTIFPNFGKFQPFFFKYCCVPIPRHSEACSNCSFVRTLVPGFLKSFLLCIFFFLLVSLKVHNLRILKSLMFLFSILLLSPSIIFLNPNCSFHSRIVFIFSHEISFHLFYVYSFLLQRAWL